jgi:hypothetical protein
MIYPSHMQVNPYFSCLVRALSLSCAAAILVVAAVQAIVHLRDLTGIQHIAGIWMALAQYSNAGILYPPLEADGVYAGTRYMPLYFVLIAVLVKIIGDYVMAAKLLALASMVSLLAGVFIAVRRITSRSLDAVILTGLMLASAEGMTALLSPHADALAAALTVVGLLVIERSRPSAGKYGLAALFLTAALMTKFSAVAGPAAAGVFLVRQDRKRPLWLLLPWFVLTASGLLLLNHVSNGRFVDNFRSLGSGGMSLDSIRIGPSRVAFAFGQTFPFAVVLPLAVFALFWRGREYGFGLWDWYFVFTAAITLVIFTSPGTGLNHLLELEVAAVLVIAQLFASQADGTRQARGFLEPIARLIVLALLLGAEYGLIREGKYAEWTDAVPGRIVVEALPSRARILAEDATVPILLGQRPVVMDAFAFRVLAEREQVDDRQLAERIARQEFEALVLMGRVDRSDESLCPRFHFGPRVTAAMQAAYRFDRLLGPYYLFVPARRDRANGISLEKKRE